jgi:hypothetical protein
MQYILIKRLYVYKKLQKKYTNYLSPFYLNLLAIEMLHMELAITNAR